MIKRDGGVEHTGVLASRDGIAKSGRNRV
jgi:hypothetical protein